MPSYLATCMPDVIDKYICLGTYNHIRAFQGLISTVTSTDIIG